MNPPDSVRDVQSRFGALNLHDAMLLGIEVERPSEAVDETVVLNLQLVAGENADRWEPARLAFRGCAHVRFDIDFWIKRLVSSAISDATCAYDLDWIRNAQKVDAARQPTQRVEYVLRFHIELVPPAGSLTLYARDFEFHRALC